MPPSDEEREHLREHELLAEGAAQPVVTEPVAEETMGVAQHGLERRPGARKRVVVMGAGIAGLVAAYELKRQGHDVVVLEAQNRVGGRVYTCREFAPGLYAEFGAMRIPRSHDLTRKYCELFDMPMRPFVMGNPKGLVHIAGLRMTMEEANANPERLPFDLEPHERGKTADELWMNAIADIKALLDREGDAAWEEIRAQYDRFSLYDFLVHRGFSDGAIEYYAVMNFVETDMNNAVMEVLREDLEGAYVDMQTIDGGMDQLPNAFFRELQQEVRFGAIVHAIELATEGVTVHFKTESGRFNVTGDYAVCALPFPCLRTVEITGGEFSHEKRKAIRELFYHASTKILFQVRRRIWEHEDGIIGGGATVTDLPIRRMNYPPSTTDTERGVLLASYSWGQDALQWGAMDPETRLEEALDDVARIHPGIRDEFEVGTSHAWYGDRWARGAFALFAPDQQTDLQAAIVAPEGRIHFAGEHCSLYHAWIQGALESGIRAAKEIHEAP
ncbi:MAG TPA: flavin monoamine oxidase family protein [Actinomycetota bacterium]|nr:flavin monoamine oxidase family protein [Actinomycetota bacterium]